MKLYGSLTSPYVRKLRLLTNFDLVAMNIYEADREKLKKISPVMKIPVLEIDGAYLYDSRVIFNELVNRGLHPQLNWERQNLLSVIDGAMDSLINRFLLKRSNIELDPTSVLGRSHGDRLSLSFAHLEEAAGKEKFEEWDFPSMSLYALMDWSLFRELQSYEKFPSLVKFHAAQSHRPRVAETDPRRAV